MFPVRLVLPRSENSISDETEIPSNASSCQDFPK
jgi:hypothetical protein